MRGLTIGVGITVVLAGIAAAVVLATGGDPPVQRGLTANVWTLASASPDGSCKRSPERETLAEALRDGRVCNPDDLEGGALMAAADAANPGDRVGIENDGVYGVQTLTAVTKKLTFEGAADARPVLRQLVMDGTSANLTFLRLDLVRGEDSSNVAATLSNGTGVGVAASNLRFEDLTIDSSYLPKRAALFDEGHDNVYVGVDVCCTVDEKLALIGGQRLTFDRVAFHDVYVTSEKVHNECLYSSGSDNLLIENSRFSACQTVGLQNSRYCGAEGVRPTSRVHDVTLRNNVFEHTLIQLGGVGKPNADELARLQCRVRGQRPRVYRGPVAGRQDVPLHGHQQHVRDDRRDPAGHRVRRLHVGEQQSGPGRAARAGR